MRVRRLCLLPFLFALSPAASADCEGAFEACKNEECEYSAKSTAIAIGSAIAATQGVTAGRQEQRALDSCVRQCEQQRLSCRAESQQRDADQARQRALEQQRAMQSRDEADADFAGGNVPPDVSSPQARKALQWIADAREHSGAGRAREALEHYESALEILPDHAEAHFGAMRAAETLKETEIARAHAARYLELEPDDPNSKAIRRKYPALVRAEEALKLAAAKGPPPARPPVPVEVPEAVWEKLEASAAYRAYRTSPLSLRSHVQWDHRWTNVDGKPDFIAFENEILVQPASTATSRETQRFMSSMGTKNHSETVTTFGGLLTIAARRSDDQQASSSRLVAVEKIEGTLFPPRPGAVMGLTTRHEYIRNDDTSVGKAVMTCRVQGATPARRVAPALPGQVWTIGCATEDYDDQLSSTTRTTRHEHYDAFATMSSQFLWKGNQLQLPPHLPNVGDVHPDSYDGDHVVKAFELSWE